MALVPKTLTEQISFYQAHAGAFEENAVALGITPEAAAALTAKVAEAQAACLAQAEAIAAARAATSVYHRIVGELRAEGAAIIAQVRTTAQKTNDDGIYGLALLPRPTKPSPIAEPGTPTNFKTSLDAVGQLTLTWDCKNPRGSEGTMYQIYRGLRDRTDMQFLGVVGKKRFVDRTIPASATALLYGIRAIRSTKQGKEVFFNVSFGTNGAQSPTEFQMKNAA